MASSLVPFIGWPNAVTFNDAKILSVRGVGGAPLSSSCGHPCRRGLFPSRRWLPLCLDTPRKGFGKSAETPCAWCCRRCLPTCCSVEVLGLVHGRRVLGTQPPCLGAFQPRPPRLALHFPASSKAALTQRSPISHFRTLLRTTPSHVRLRYGGGRERDCLHIAYG
jgi:hypothetical protein